MKKLFAICSLALALLAGGLVPKLSAQTQVGTLPIQQATGVPYQMAGAWVFNSASGSTAAFPVKGLSFYLVTFVPSGTVGACSVSIDSAAAVNTLGAPVSPVTGGILASSAIGSCAAAGSYSNSTSAGISNFGILTPTVTGSGSVTITVFGYITNPAATSGSAASIGSPVDGSGFVEVNCKTGCSGTSLGQTTMSASEPVTIASNQSALNVSQSGTWTVSQGTGSNLHVVCDSGCSGAALGQTTMSASLPVAIASNQSALPVTGTFFQTTQPVSGTFFQTTQPISGSVSQAGGWNVGQSGSWTVTASQATGSNLHVVCDSGCSGASTFADNGAFTQGTTPINVLGGYYTTGAAPTITNGSAARARVDSNSYLLIDCATGCTGGGGAADEAAFTQGTSNYGAIGGTYNSSITNLTSGQGGAVQLTNDRTMMVTARMQSYNGSAWANAVNWGADTSAFTAGTTPTIPIGGVYTPSANCTSGDQCAAALTVDRKLFVQTYQGNVADTAPVTQNITAQDSASTSTTVANGGNFITGTPTANSAANFVLGSGFATSLLQVTGSWTGTLTVEASIDGGTTWVTAGIHQQGTSYLASSFTGNFLGENNSAGYTNVRVRATAAWTGTATAKIVQTINNRVNYVANPMKIQDGTVNSTVNTVKAASTAAVATDTALVVAISPNNTVPVSGTVSTQAAGFGALIGFQQAVTASAVALTSNASHSFCVAALPANTINIFVGPSGVTTSTGFPLQPGQTGCWTLSNTNLMYVISTATGASVAVTGS